MLKHIRNNASGPVTKTLLTLLILAFASWGIGDYISGGHSGNAMQVNDSNIHANTLATLYRLGGQQAARQLGQTHLDNATLHQLNVPQQVLSNLIQNTLIRQQAEDMGLVVSEAQLSRQIQNNSAFNGADGKFDMTAYKTTLRNAGFTVEGYERELANETLLATMRTVFNGAQPTEKAVTDLLNYELASLDLRVIEIPRSAVPKQAEPTEAEMRKTYDETTQGQGAMSPEMRSAHVVQVNIEDVAKGLTISSSQIKTAYEAGNYTQPEKRQARHILVKTEEEAKALRGKITNATSFERFAKEKSIDTFSAQKGGDLGLFKKTDMVPSFADAAFSLQQGELSQPVESPFGWHLIRVESIQPARKQTLAEVKDDIKGTLQREQAEELYDDLLQQVDDRIAGGESLPEIAKALDLPLSTFNHFNEAGQPEKEEQAAPQPALVETAFILNEGDISTPLPLADNTTAFVEVTSVVPPRQLTFEDVQDKLKEAMMLARITQAGQKMASDLSVKLANSKNPASVAKASGFNVSTQKNLLRNGTNLPANIDKRGFQNLFNLDVGQGMSSSTQNGFVVAQIMSKNSADLEPAIVSGATTALTRQMNEDLRWQFLIHQHSEAKVSYNIPLLRQVFGEELTTQSLPVRGQEHKWYDIGYRLKQLFS